MNKVNNILRIWVMVAVAVSGLSAMVYLTVQQVLRQGANDPQIQLAQDAAAALDAGAKVDEVVYKVRIAESADPSTGAVQANLLTDLGRSAAPFLVVYDTEGKPIVSSGMLDGKMPEYPLGALEAAKPTGENRVTWQPRQDVRIASVVVRTKKGYVVAGRSLREVEQREAQTGNIVLVTWLATLLAGLAAAAFGEYVLGG